MPPRDANRVTGAQPVLDPAAAYAGVGSICSVTSRMPMQANMARARNAPSRSRRFGSASLGRGRGLRRSGRGSRSAGPWWRRRTGPARHRCAAGRGAGGGRARRGSRSCAGARRGGVTTVGRRAVTAWAARRAGRSRLRRGPPADRPARRCARCVARRPGRRRPPAAWAVAGPGSPARPGHASAPARAPTGRAACRPAPRRSRPGHCGPGRDRRRRPDDPRGAGCAADGSRRGSGVRGGTVTAPGSGRSSPTARHHPASGFR